MDLTRLLEQIRRDEGAQRLAQQMRTGEWQ